MCIWLLALLQTAEGLLRCWVLHPVIGSTNGIKGSTNGRGYLLRPPICASVEHLLPSTAMHQGPSIAVPQVKALRMLRKYHDGKLRSRQSLTPDVGPTSNKPAIAPSAVSALHNAA
jgi:hypothetical protein